jgi:16S rRNA processing protein RimM
MTVPPPDLVALGAVRGAYGVKGWVRIAPYAADGAVLLQQRAWWLQRATSAEPLELSAVRRHGDQVVAKWHGCETPEDADALKSAEVAVARSAFPPLDENEYYLADLVGARVFNRTGEELGRVQGLRSNGAQQWLEVKPEQEVGRGGAAMLIPLVESYIDAIDVAGHEVRVDWQGDW